ncbi:hypothetical protein AKJ49_00080 [candidate division MSBL1 archaeon SCGC-AAA382A03]|uniref:Calcineurin-like phosphoesterase domain-containing protein n=1 Tax=candidate division MSBL1 archaeon SCGC-AAA382A03 TaxID=1698278 RepID=A0A133VH87_9EURY|nr:hypothetical protein AKJ49_00080 [candidate division MSBL1 archaeon SCGC-AAA382A03]
MKIAIISDFHLGAKEDGLREEDPFEQAKEAVEKALELGAQLILISGDIFDSRIPKQEVWSKGMRILSFASEKKNRDVSLLDTIDKKRGDITDLPFRGAPVIAIHGNHERRGKGFVDSIEALESSGLVIRLHHNGVVLNSEGVNVAIQGMGYVPGEFAKDFLERWQPSPIEGSVNIFMLHQGLGRFTYSASESSKLQPADLPEGFDLYISGHVHYKVESEVHGKPLIFPGSTFRTQLLPVEARNPKGFYMLELTDESLDYEFVKLNSPRDFFYEKKEFERTNPLEVENWVRDKVNEFLQEKFENPDRRPLARIRLVGSLSKGSSRSEINSKDIEAEFEDKILLSITKEDLSSPELEEKTEFLRNIRKENISMEERGLKILESKLNDLNYDRRFDSSVLYDLLSGERTEEALDEVMSEIDKITEAKLEEES